MTLKPTSRTIADFTMTPAFLAIGTLIWFAAGRHTLPSYVVATVLLLAAVYLVVRGSRLRVVCAGDTVTVHGYLWSRTLSTKDIYAVTFMPQYRYAPRLRWHDARGRDRATIITPFTVGSSGWRLPQDTVLAVRMADQLRTWISESQTRLGVNPREPAP